MDTTDTIITIVVIVVVIAALIGALRMFVSRQALQARYGDEYDRTVDQLGSRSAAVRELRRRTKEHDTLRIRQLSPTEQAPYIEDWQAVQARFIDDPSAAVGDAQALVDRIVTDLGYPEAEPDERLAHLSVEHAYALEHYRAAHDITGRAATEDLRQALVHYRSLVADLLGDDPDEIEPALGTPDITVTAGGTDTTPAADRNAVANAETDPPAGTDPAPATGSVIETPAAIPPTAAAIDDDEPETGPKSRRGRRERSMQ